MAFILSTQTLKTQSINRKPNYDDIAEKFFENNILEIIYALAYVAISSSYQSGVNQTSENQNDRYFKNLSTDIQTNYIQREV